MELNDILEDFMNEEKEKQPDWIERMIEKFESKEAFFDFMIDSIQEQETLAEARKELSNKKLELAKQTQEWVERKKDLLTIVMNKFGDMKYESDKGKLSFRKSEKVITWDNLSKEYMKEKVTYSPDKTLIKEKLKAWEEVVGAYIDTVQNIQIK